MEKSHSQKQKPQTESKVFSKAFRDPIHDLIYLGPKEKFILDLIDTKEFQRLRRIRQLGLAHFVFPGAEHTRFTHSLGVFNFARRVINRLLERHSSKSSHDKGICKELRSKEKEIKAAALLHDLGHGPFSHVYERVFRKDGGKSHKHDIWSCKILFDPITEVHQVLKKNGIDINLLAAIISDDAEKEFTDVEHPDEPYLKDIISSQLDVDRMDYLLRDSLMSGSRYGRYDHEWVFNAFTIGTVPYANKSLKKLCLDASKGTGAIEGFLFARLLMLKNVYGHKTTRAYESELVCTLQLAVELSDILPDDTPKPVLETIQNKGGIDINTYLNAGRRSNVVGAS